MILTSDLLATYKYLLLHGFLHKRVTTRAYEKNFETWSGILLSLEASLVLGFDRILEHKKYFGHEFESEELNDIVKRINNIRKKLVAHIDLQVVKNKDAFLEKNSFNGTQAIKLIDALKKRAIALQKAFKYQLDVEALFKDQTKRTMNDLDLWLKSFQEPL